MFITALFLLMASPPAFAGPDQIILVEDSRPANPLIVVEDSRPFPTALRPHMSAVMAWYRSWLASGWFD